MRLVLARQNAGARRLSPRVYLVRHGQTEWNIAGKAQGHTDTPLDETGIAQAIALSRVFRNVTLEIVITSDLARAHATAQEVARATGASLEVTPMLRERSFGDWEGSSFLTVRAAFEQAETGGVGPLDFRPPGGESLRDVWSRVQPLHERLATIQVNVVVVTHGGSCGLILASLLGAPIEVSRSFRFGNTAVTELERRPDGGWVLLRFADTIHLDEASSPMIDTSHGRS